MSSSGDETCRQIAGHNVTFMHLFYALHAEWLAS